MTTSQSAMESLVSSVQTHLSDFLADQYSSEQYPYAGKIVTALALFGVYNVSRNLFKHSKALTKYCLLASRPIDVQTLVARYGGPPAAAMILNSADQLGNAYSHQLASYGFAIILCGPPIDQERMDGQASLIADRYQVTTKVIIIDYAKIAARDENSYQEIGEALAEHEVCILVNNQTYSVPFDYARADLLNQSIEACVAQINKHINGSLLIQQLILPKMLTRNQAKNVRSAILTLKTHANALFEQSMGQTFQFPILRSALAFNDALTKALHDGYTNKGIDVMQVFSPHVAFESWLSRGLILEVVMQERMVNAHVRSVLNHLQMGYDETHGTFEEALANNFQMLRLRFHTPMNAMQARFFERYASLAEERREEEVIQVEQLKANEDMNISREISTATAPDKDVEAHEVEVQTSFVVVQTYRSEGVEEVEESEEEQWLELDAEEQTYEEFEFQAQPMEGDTLELYNARRVYQAEMSSNNRAVLAATKQTTETLMKQRSLGKPVTLKSVEVERQEIEFKQMSEINLKASQSTAAESLAQSLEPETVFEKAPEPVAEPKPVVERAPEPVAEPVQKPSPPVQQQIEPIETDQEQNERHETLSDTPRTRHKKVNSINERYRSEERTTPRQEAAEKPQTEDSASFVTVEPKSTSNESKTEVVAVAAEAEPEAVEESKKTVAPSNVQILSSEPVLKPHAQTPSADQSKKDLASVPALSVAPSEDTNDTNNVSEQGEDSKKAVKMSLPQGPQPKPYNRMSEERAKLQSEEGEKKQASEIETEEIDHEQFTDVEISNREKATPDKEDKKDSARSKESGNPFNPKLSPIEEPNDAQAKLRQGAETPAFREKSIDIPDSESAEKSEKENAMKTKERSLSPFVRVKMHPTPDRNSLLNKSGTISQNKSQLSRDASIENGEWRQTAFKQISVTNMASTMKMPNVVPILVPPIHDEHKDSKSLPRDEYEVNIIEQTLDASDDEEEKKHLEGRKSIGSEHQRKPSLHEIMTETVAPLSGRLDSSKPIVSPRRDDLSSTNADMQELKMMLGGQSDRSGNQVVFNQSKNLFDDQGVIFSDEGSEDSFKREDGNGDVQEDLWALAEKKPKASLQFLRSTTLKLQKGDETDQAINKVLQNLVKYVLTDFDPDAIENDPNMTKAQKLEKRNQHLIYELATCLPFVKLSQGRYIVGTEIRSIQIKGRGVLVRTGGGYMYLSEYLLHYAKSECLRMGLLMMKEKKTYQKVVISLLKKHPNTESAQKEFIKKCPDGIDQQFQDCLQEVRDLETKMQKRRQRQSLKQKSPTKKSLNTSLNLSMRSSDSNGGRKTMPLIIQSLTSKPVLSTLSSGGRNSPTKSKNGSGSQGGQGLDSSMRLSSNRSQLRSPPKKSLKKSSTTAKLEILNRSRNELNNSVNLGAAISTSSLSSSLFTPVRSRVNTGKNSVSPSKPSRLTGQSVRQSQNH